METRKHYHKNYNLTYFKYYNVDYFKELLAYFIRKDKNFNEQNMRLTLKVYYNIMAGITT